MSGTRYSARPALRRRDNEFLGDMAAWRREAQSDHSERLERLRRNLREARRQERTALQAPVPALSYGQALSGTALGTDPFRPQSTLPSPHLRGRS